MIDEEGVRMLLFLYSKLFVFEGFFFVGGFDNYKGEEVKRLEFVCVFGKFV